MRACTFSSRVKKKKPGTFFLIILVVLLLSGPPPSFSFIFASPPSQLCDGFSGAMLNLTGRSIPIAQSPSLWPSLNGAVGPVTWLLLKHGCLSREGPCCVSRKPGGGETEGRGGDKRATWVFYESGPLGCYAF